MACNTRNLRLRSRLLRVIREFFHDRGFVEVETPVRVKTPALEDYIDAEPSGDCFLRTSPELHMKRLLPSGLDRIFQIGPCFRQGERSQKHRPEFAMLEWYEAHTDYDGILETTQALLLHCASTLTNSTELPFQGQRIDLNTPWPNLTVADAFKRYTTETVESAIERDQFEILLVDKIEPNLDQTRPTILRNYPTAVGALAKVMPGQPKLVERWELYIGGLEIANAYSELTDAQEQLSRFTKTAELREGLGKTAYPVDEEFMAALAAGLPACSGCALGIDRLAMIFCNTADIGTVRAFGDCH